ncbi:hypothetical protein, partial [Klebsiella pneumoniae]|uniref:hypothetical protein n=1 Tax=Klebsiella pneumoniae TaxID=573 RepID=UPI0027F1B03F
KRAYCLKTQPATGETYPKSDLFNKAPVILNSKSIWWGSIPTMLAVSGILNAPFHCSPNKSFAS